MGNTKDYRIEDKLAETSNEFRVLFEEHILLEQDLEALYSLKYFPPEVEARIKEIKINKLKLKDRMQIFIQQFKNKESTND